MRVPFEGEGHVGRQRMNVPVPLSAQLTNIDVGAGREVVGTQRLAFIRPTRRSIDGEEAHQRPTAVPKWIPVSSAFAGKGPRPATEQDALTTLIGGQVTMIDTVDAALRYRAEIDMRMETCATVPQLRVFLEARRAFDEFDCIVQAFRAAWSSDDEVDDG